MKLHRPFCVLLPSPRKPPLARRTKPEGRRDSSPTLRPPARAIYPWFLGTDAGAQILMHVIAFGAPLGFFLAMRLQVLDRELRVDRREPLRP